MAVHTAVALFGFAALFGAWLPWSPGAIVLGRTVVAAATLALIAATARSFRAPGAGLALNGIILAVHWVAFFHAVQLAGVAIGLLGYATFPLFVLVLERLLIGRRWTWHEGWAAVAAVAGIAVLVPSFDIADATLRGLAWGIASGATFAWLAVRQRRHAERIAPPTIAMWQNVFAALALAPFVLADPGAWPRLTPRDVALVVVLGTVCTALSHTLFIASMRRLSAHTASIVATLEPVYGIALAAWLVGERPTLRTLAGAALIVGAALHASRRAE